MASFIYLYSKFTEEFLLLSAAGIFTLLSIYCYTWVVKKRRLGAARDQVPAGMVKIYLGQLINEAQFVRTQLFGLAGGAPGNADSFAAHFQQMGAAPAPAPISYPTDGSVSPDLLERLKALETQLAEKESMVVNVNVEKTKLLEEVENLRQDQKAVGAAPTGDNADLLKKMKALEERLEEYALFEDDLANLKRLQQENAELKKRIEAKSQEPQVDTVVPATPAPAPVSTTVSGPKVEANENEVKLDQAAVEALLEGASPVPPTPVAAEPAPAPVAAAPKADEFEKIVDKVETSLAKPAAPEPAVQAAAPPKASIAEKSDEELLKEFENLLNS